MKETINIKKDIILISLIESLCFSAQINLVSDLLSSFGLCFGFSRQMSAIKHQNRLNIVRQKHRHVLHTVYDVAEKGSNIQHRKRKYFVKCSNVQMITTHVYVSSPRTNLSPTLNAPLCNLKSIFHSFVIINLFLQSICIQATFSFCFARFKTVFLKDFFQLTNNMNQWQPLNFSAI